MHNFNLGYFLSQNHFNRGFELLKMQLGEGSYTFRCMDLEIYRNEKYLENFNTSNFYNKYIKDDLFYNYRLAFYNRKYPKPKGITGLRYFDFSTFYLQVLYYSCGFYIGDVIHKSISLIKHHKKQLGNIHTYYGGSINFKYVNKSNIYYQDDYKNFMKNIKFFIKKGISDRKVLSIKVDVQNFYDSIIHEKLLEIIDNYSFASSNRKKNFNKNSKESLKNILFLINHSNKGLPLSKQNIISNFLSYLYFLEFDNYIEIYLRDNEEQFSYQRYVDDIYILIYQNTDKDNEEIGDLAKNILSNISNYILENFSLKLNNNKTDIQIIEDEDDYDDFICKGNFVSFYDPAFKTNPDKPKETLDRIIEIISKIESEYKKNGSVKLSDIDKSVLNEVFIKRVMTYLNSEEAKDKLEEALKGWNPLLTNHSIKTLMYLLGKSKNGMKIIQNYLEVNAPAMLNNAHYLNLFEQFILHDHYNGQLDEVILSDDNSNFYKKLLSRLVSAGEDELIKDLNINDDILAENKSLSEQVKKLNLSELKNEYNLAFNHLLNCFHNLCYIKDNTKKEPKNYKSIDVIRFLGERVSSEEIKNVADVFDRRNKNTISHPGEDELENWIVDKQEYFKYKNLINDIMGKYM